MTTNTLSTTIAEPSITADEAETLLFALERSRAQLAWKVGGLDAEALRRPFPPSGMTLGGLVKHLALVEERQMAEFVDGRHLEEPWRRERFEADPDWDWHSAADDTPEELYALWERAVARSRAGWAAALARGGLDQPSLCTLPDGTSPNLRRVLVDTHDEDARHVGHADLFREAVDGLVGEDPPQP
ncbi:DUF664 domain-containing protein [Cellulomonas fimi]|uniref:Mini-circle protein n=1 Tax=Cellulomonas fimi (strain ATCC 484 / DSM 20113 / JCM 1341 / CCUG 24087 / LMG 16345 / NBRC 15513 / NCIMB 8980 / NCTC 7547 / NRS-133) TaxID=590998 RepID=F4H4S2_CELFA|nr:DUF664 domain-containing protein [Cellulomonas fimi]AEE44273.1 protein of unknown function DUF664 [Cellulomonas fimi ATCC 484]NNH05720.1 DUF664 domain-containing protein [Cellulomonas fimi]VEH26016.1 Protein of uncharacterised function (DUF664) [Cellulomonas fimi]